MGNFSIKSIMALGFSQQSRFQIAGAFYASSKQIDVGLTQLIFS